MEAAGGLGHGGPESKYVQIKIGEILVRACETDHKEGTRCDQQRELLVAAGTMD